MPALESLPAGAHKVTPSIAVLPFENMSGDKENEYFSDGLAEEILNLLTRVPGLKVIARTSAFAFKGKHEDVRQIALALGVTNVLEGSVRKPGSRIRVTAQLIAAADGSHLWSERYDRELADVFTVQDEMASAIRECLERAITLDPQFALAHAELAHLFARSTFYGAVPPREALPFVRAEARRALAIDASIPEGHAMLGLVAAMFEYDWPEEGYVHPIGPAIFHLLRGDIDRTADWAEKAIEERQPAFLFFLNAHAQVLRSSARWPRLARMMNLPEQL